MGVDVIASSKMDVFMIQKMSLEKRTAVGENSREKVVRGPGFPQKSAWIYLEIYLISGLPCRISGLSDRTSTVK